MARISTQVRGLLGARRLGVDLQRSGVSMCLACSRGAKLLLDLMKSADRLPERVTALGRHMPSLGLYNPGLTDCHLHSFPLHHLVDPALIPWGELWSLGMISSMRGDHTIASPAIWAVACEGYHLRLGKRGLRDHTLDCFDLSFLEVRRD